MDVLGRFDDLADFLREAVGQEEDNTERSDSEFRFNVGRTLGRLARRFVHGDFDLANLNFEERPLFIGPRLEPIAVKAKRVEDVPVLAIQAPAVQMPRFLRRKRRVRFRRKPLRGRKRRRRFSRVRRVKRRRRTSLRRRKPRIPRPVTANRHLKNVKMIKFILYGQVRIQSTTNGWGIVRVPMNTMERPFVYFQIPAATSFLLKCSTIAAGDTSRRPMGVDRWLTTIGGSTTEEGHYGKYEVMSSKVTITHLPGQRLDTGVNLMGGINTYATSRVSELQRGDMQGTVDIDNVTAIGDIYASHLVSEVTSLLYKGAPFTSLKHFNQGDTGTTWVMKWNQKTAKRKNKSLFRTTSDTVISQQLDLQGPIDADFVVQNGHFMVASFSDNAAADLDFLVKMEYTCKLNEPTDWLKSIADAALGGQFVDDTDP